MSRTQSKSVRRHEAYLSLLCLTSECRPVEEILNRTDSETLMKIYNLPQIGPTLEFLTMLALTTGRLHKVDSLVVNSTVLKLMSPHRAEHPMYLQLHE